MRNALPPGARGRFEDVPVHGGSREAIEACQALAEGRTSGGSPLTFFGARPERVCPWPWRLKVLSLDGSRDAGVQA